MRRVYNIKCRVVYSSGIMGLLIKGQPVEGFIIVDSALDSDFDEFIGKNFEIRANLTKAPFIESMADELKYYIGNFIPVSRYCVFEIDRSGIKGVLTMSVSADTKSVSSITCVVKKRWYGDIIIKGIGESTTEMVTKTHWK